MIFTEPLPELSSVHVFRMICGHCQVNASPSLSTTTESDRIMKSALLRDIFAVVAPNVPASLPEYDTL